MEKIIIDGNHLKIEDVFQVSKNNVPVDFPENKKFWEKLTASRHLLESKINEGYPIYGVTTGFGDSCHNQINSKKTQSLQKALIDFHGIGVGQPFSLIQARAITLVRLNSNVKGYSAITVELAQLMKEFINRGIIPVIPQIGSVGASGDLTPLSYLGATLMGERDVYYKGKIVAAKTALKEENLTAIKLQAKEGLAIMNGTSVMTGIAALAWIDARRLAHISDFITAATAEIMQAKEIPYREKVSQIKNHCGQVESARMIGSILKTSKQIYQYETLLNKIGPIDCHHYKKHDIKIQDRYSLRCAPQINGVLRDTLHTAREWIENEINSANDNPLVDPEENIIYNSGNFYGGHICAACDYIRIGLANISDMAEKQAELIIDGKFNQLTENLIPRVEEGSHEKGLYHGFKAAQISISALCCEIQYLSAPVSIHSRPTESLNQDKVSLGTISARKLNEMVDLLYDQYAIHLLAICQALDLIGKEKFSQFTRSLYQEVRKLSAFLEKDRPLDQEAKSIKELIKNSDLFNA